MTNPRDLIRRLADELDRYRQLLMGDGREAHALATEARAFLAQPEPEAPTDIELAAILKQAVVDFPPNHPDAKALNSLEYEIEIELRKARAVLARSGRPVFRQKELTDEQLLKCFKIATPCYDMEGWRRELDGMRAAIAADRALCARLAVEPVPVSERPILKASDFNDADGRCWCGSRGFIDETGDTPVEMPASWELREPDSQDDWVLPYDALAFALQRSPGDHPMTDTNPRRPKPPSLKERIKQAILSSDTGIVIHYSDDRIIIESSILDLTDGANLANDLRRFADALSPGAVGGFND